MNTHTGKYKCTECGKCCVSNYVLAKHRQSHSEQKPFKRTVSNEGFTTKRGLTVRRKRHTGKQLYTCSHCGKHFPFRNYLSAHMNTHTGKYKCTECGKCCINNGVLAKHKQSHSEQKPFKRTVSNEGFTTKCYLTVRRKRHTGKQLCSCSHCGKRFLFRTSLSAHMNTHTGKYKCTECGRCCVNNRELAVHRQSHSEQKPFKRTVSSKQFTTKCYLTVRRKRHTGKQLYTCSHCGKHFSFQSNLYSHMNTHTDKYKCTECGRCCPNNYELAKHRQRHSEQKQF